jgi:hypothetical protein
VASPNTTFRLKLALGLLGALIMSSIEFAMSTYATNVFVGSIIIDVSTFGISLVLHDPLHPMIVHASNMLCVQYGILRLV